MCKWQRLGMLWVGVVVVWAVIISLAQIQTATADETGGPLIYLPVVLTPDCQEYFDDFSDPNSGWVIDDNEQRTLSYADEEYSIASKEGGFVFGSVGPLAGRENYVTEVEAHYPAPPTDGFYGLMFGVKREGANNSVSEYYLFAIEPDTQEFGLFYRDPAAAFDAIVSPTFSGAINMGTAVNVLTAVRNGNQITLKVNDTTLGTWSDARITGDTQIGIAMWADPVNPVAEARFDNFTSHICIDDELSGTFQANRVLTSQSNRGMPLTVVVQDTLSDLSE